MREVPLGRGYLEAGAAVTRLRGPEAWLEAGAHPWRNVGLYGRAYAGQGDVGVMAGLHAEW